MIEGETVASGAKIPEGAKLKVVGRGGTWYVAIIEEDGSPFSRETIYLATWGAATDVMMEMKRLDPAEWQQTIRVVRR